MIILFLLYFFFFFKQKTAYEMRISDWSSDVCSSDLLVVAAPRAVGVELQRAHLVLQQVVARRALLLDRTGRRYMVGGDGVAQHGQRPCAGDVADRLGNGLHLGEERRILDRKNVV